MLNRYTTPTTPNSLASTPRLPSDLLLRYAAETNRQNELAKEDADSVTNMLSSMSAKLASPDAAEFQNQFSMYSDLINQVNESGDYRAMTSQLRRNARELVAKASDPNGFYSRAANWNAAVREMASELEKDKDKLYSSVYNVNRRRLMQAAQGGFTGTGGVTPVLLQNVQGKDFDFFQAASRVNPTKRTVASDPVWDPQLGKMRIRYYDEEIIDPNEAMRLITESAVNDPEYLRNLRGRAEADYYELLDTSPELLRIETPNGGTATKDVRSFVEERINEEINQRGRIAAENVARRNVTFKDTFFDDPNQPAGRRGAGDSGDMSGAISGGLLSPVGTDYSSVEGFVQQLGAAEKQTMDAIAAQLRSSEEAMAALYSNPNLSEESRRMRIQAIQGDMQALYDQQIQEEIRFDTFKSNAERIFADRGISFKVAAKMLGTGEPGAFTSFLTRPGSPFAGLAGAVAGAFPKKIELSSAERRALLQDINESYGQVLYETDLIPFSTDREMTAASNLLLGMGGGAKKSAGFTGSVWASGENAGKELDASALEGIHKTRPIGVVGNYENGDYNVVAQVYDKDDNPMGVITVKNVGITRREALARGFVSPEYDLARGWVHSTMKDGGVSDTYDGYRVRVNRGADGRRGIRVEVFDPSGEPVLIRGLDRDFETNSLLLNALAGIPKAITDHKTKPK